MDNYFKASDILDKAIGTDAYFQIKSILFGIETADVAPVIRCRECKHFNLETHECENEALSTDHEGGASYSLNFYDDDFCSYGERRNTYAE